MTAQSRELVTAAGRLIPRLWASTTGCQPLAGASAGVAAAIATARRLPPDGSGPPSAAAARGAWLRQSRAFAAHGHGAAKRLGLAEVEHVVAVASGKGGVGKSTVAGHPPASGPRSGPTAWGPGSQQLSCPGAWQCAVRAVL
jgi:Mrp family chromosome partitioning ATPase